MSLGETSLRPTAMLFRNLASMDVEESIRGNPIDGVVLLCGCDKTTPSLIMGAASCDLPSLVVSGGPMLNGKYRGTEIGSGTDVWRFSEEVRAGTMSLKEFMQAESCMSRSSGTCNVMGTASTMASMVGSARARRCRTTRRFRPWIRDDTPRRTWPAAASSSWSSRTSGSRSILTRAAFENAIRVNGAIGGSTNAVLHLLAMAGRDERAALAAGLGRLRPRRADDRGSDAVGPLPDGRLLLRRRSAGRDAHARRARPAPSRRDDGQRHTRSGRTCQDAAELQRRRHPAARSAAGGERRHRGAAREPGAGRRGAQAVGGIAAPDAPSRPRGRVREHRALQRRASTIRISTSTRDCVLVLKGCGPKGYPGHGGGRQHGSAAEGAADRA